MDPGMVPESRLDDARAEIERLRAALAVFAERDNWECFDVCDDEDDGEYRAVSNFRPSELPWTIASEALAAEREM